jgi:hypothetical protein
MTLRLASVALAMGALFLCASEASACDCEAGTIPPLEALAQADAVFAGLVIEIDAPFAEGVFDPRARRRVRRLDAPRLCRFLVDASWKGVQGDTLVVITSGSSCTYKFERGRRYLVYAYTQPFPLKGFGSGRRGDPGPTWPDTLGPQPRYETDLCTRTRPLEEADIDFCQFRAPGHLRRGASVPNPDPDKVLGDLLERIHAEWPQVSWPALQPLADLRFGFDVTVPLLAELVEAGNQQAASILAEYGPAGRPAIPALARALCDTSYYVRAQAYVAIHRMCPDARDIVIPPALNGSDLPDCAVVAERVLGDCPCSWKTGR